MRVKIAPDLKAFVVDWAEVDAGDTSKPNRYQAVMQQLLGVLRLAREVQDWADTPATANRKLQVDDRVMRALRTLEKASQP